jgi:hypothetical protein
LRWKVGCALSNATCAAFKLAFACSRWASDCANAARVGVVEPGDDLVALDALPFLDRHPTTLPMILRRRSPAAAQHVPGRVEDGPWAHRHVPARRAVAAPTTTPRCVKYHP